MQLFVDSEAGNVGGDSKIKVVIGARKFTGPK